MQTYKNIPKIIPAILKQNLANFLIIFTNEFLAGGRNTNADNISDVDIFFIVVLFIRPCGFSKPARSNLTFFIHFFISF